jgi:ABC-type multidrug transport system fused ATPase/permease subunit
MSTSEDGDDIISNYITEIYNNCNKIITEYDTNKDINSLFKDLEKYSTSEFEKYNSETSYNIDNINNIFKTILNSNYSFLDETNKKYIENLLDLYSNGFSKFISLFNIKEIPNPHSDSLIRFFNYEIKDNFEMFYLKIVLLPYYHKLSQILSDRQSNIFSGILLLSLLEIRNNLVLLIKKKEILFFKKYLLSDLKLTYEKTYSKILKDTKNKTKYNLILKKYIQNNLQIYLYYNKVIFKLFDIAFDIFYLSYKSLQLNINLGEIFLINSVAVFNFYMEFLDALISLEKNKEHFLKIKEQINIYLNDIIKNFNIINESNTYPKEFDNISLGLSEMINIMYNDDIQIMGWIMNSGNNVENIYILSKYILFLLIKYDSGISFQLDYIKQQTFITRERLYDLSIYYSDNVETEKILNAIIEDIERNDLFIKDSEILFTIENLSHCFGKNLIFENVNLTIPKNSWICLYGNSGSGKTTLCNMILKQLEPDIGTIKYMGIHNDYKYTDICKDISYVTASPELFENTILYNILYGVNNSEDKEIQEKMNYYVKLFGLDVCDLKDNVNTLSTGQKQRVSIIRLILQDRPIMILDEITSNIDNEMEKIILEEIRKIQKEKNKTVIHITHNIENKVFSDINLYILNKDIIRVK